MNETKHLPQTRPSRLLLCLFVFFVYLKPHSLVVLGASFCIQHPRCLIVTPSLPPCSLAFLRCSTHAQRVGSQVKPIASTAWPRRRAGSAAVLRPTDSPSFANGASAAVSGPRTASVALIGPHGCGLQKGSAELSEQFPPPPNTHTHSISLYH